MRSVKKILATALAFAMVTSVSVPVMAAEVPVAEEQTVVVTDESVDNLDNGIAPLDTLYYRIGGSSYTTIPCKFGASGGNFSVLVLNSVPGIDGQKAIAYDPSKYQMDIIMYGRNGMLWQEKECLHDVNYRVFQCSSEVTSICLRIIPRTGWFPAPTRVFDVQVTY